MMIMQKRIIKYRSLSLLSESKKVFFRITILPLIILFLFHPLSITFSETCESESIGNNYENCCCKKQVNCCCNTKDTENEENSFCTCHINQKASDNERKDPVNSTRIYSSIDIKTETSGITVDFKNDNKESHFYYNKKIPSGIITDIYIQNANLRI